MAAPRFNPAGHLLLSAPAAALNTLPPDGEEGGGVDALDEHAEVAALVLGLGAYQPPDPASAASAVRAVALQVNYQVELGPAGGTKWGETKGDEGVVYARNFKTGVMPPASPAAQLIADQLLTAAAEAASAARTRLVMGNRPHSAAIVFGF